MELDSVRELTRGSTHVWRPLAQAKDLIVTSNGKPIALLLATLASTFDAMHLSRRCDKRRLSLRSPPCRTASARLGRIH